MMRVVADTNVVVSAFLWGGNPRAILDPHAGKTSRYLPAPF
jgi:predicted nucleic acid-binding protein